MKKRLCILAAAFCLAATPVFAQENSGDTIEATAATAEEMSDDMESEEPESEETEMSDEENEE